MSGWPLAAACGVLAVLSGLLLWELYRALKARAAARVAADEEQGR